MSGRRPPFEIGGRGGGLPLISIAAMPFSRPLGGGPRRSLGSLLGGTAGNGLSNGPAPGGRRAPALHAVNGSSRRAAGRFTYEFSIVFRVAVYRQGSRAGRRIHMEVVRLKAAGALIEVAPNCSAATWEDQPSNRMPGLHILVQGRSLHHRTQIRSPHLARRHQEALLTKPGTGHTASTAAAFGLAVTGLDKPWLRAQIGWFSGDFCEVATV